MKGTTSAFLAFALTTQNLFVSALPDPSSGLALSPRDGITEWDQVCDDHSTNGKTNGLTQAFYWGFADACKDAVYPDGTTDVKKADAGGPIPGYFRYTADNWAAYFNRTNHHTDACYEVNLRCSDIVGKNADGRGTENDLGNNFEYCWPRTLDKVYHGGQVPRKFLNGSHRLLDGTGLYYDYCGTVKIWRCKDGECDQAHDAPG